MARLPRTQRLAAYAVILADERILLCRLSDRVTPEELWTLPGGGVDHGEDPRDAVVREVEEETGLRARVAESARVYSAHMPGVWRSGRKVDAHAVRIVYDGWVPPDSPPPAVQEVDGSTVEADWVPLADVLSGRVPTVPMVGDALADHRPRRVQRAAAYALLQRGPGSAEVLLTRISARGHRPGVWTLPGGGIEHGESPEQAMVREVAEECGVVCIPGPVLLVHDVHFTGVAPTGRTEDYHGLHLVYAATLAGDVEPRVVEVEGTTDAVAWVARDDVAAGRVEVLDVVRAALEVPRQ